LKHLYAAEKRLRHCAVDMSLAWYCHSGSKQEQKTINLYGMVQLWWHPPSNEKASKSTKKERSAHCCHSSSSNQEQKTTINLCGLAPPKQCKSI